MSKKLSDYTINKLYNKQNKFNYLKNSGVEDGTQVTYATKLLIVTEIETLLEKDLYDFDEKDILYCFESVSDKNSRSSLRSLFSICKKYVDWAVEKGLNRTGMNPFTKMKFEIDIVPILYDKDFKNKFLTEEQVWKLLNFSINTQDTACLIPAFYGIKGSQCCELINLKDSDIDSVNNTVTLVTDINKETGEILSTRTIAISKELIDILKKSWGQDEYNRRGKPGYGERVTAKLHNSPYVLRPTTVKGKEYVTTQTVAARSKKILKDAGYSNMSIDEVYKSGKLNLLKHIKQKKGKELEIEDYKKVNRHFGDGISNYKMLRELYESTIVDDKLDVLSEKSLWDEVYLLDYEESEKYEDDFSDVDENYMNNSDEDTSIEGEKNVTHGERCARSMKARNRCIEIYGAKCYICDFDFKKIYGDIGEGVIHVHHLKKLSEDDKNHIVNARKDLRPVCPNCHSILHKRKEPFSIDDVEEMIKNNKDKLDNYI